MRNLMVTLRMLIRCETLDLVKMRDRELSCHPHIEAEQHQFHAQQKDLATAKERFRKLTEIESENYRGWLYLGMAQTEGREFDAARESFLKAWKLQQRTSYSTRGA